MSEPGNHEQNEPQRQTPPPPELPVEPGHVSGAAEEPGGEERKAHMPSPEEVPSPEELLARQRLDRAEEGKLTEAIEMGRIPDEMRPLFQNQALEQLGEISNRDEPPTADEIHRIKQMLKVAGMTKSEAEHAIAGLRHFSEEQKAEFLEEFPEKFEGTKQADKYEKKADEDQEAYEQRLINEMRIEQMQNNELIEDAQAMAKQIESKSDYIFKGGAGVNLKNRYKAAKHLLDHKIKDIKEYFNPDDPKEWLRRGGRYSFAFISALFLFIVWEMKFIGQMAKKK